MFRSLMMIALLGAVLLFAGCRENADDFFSGRPSGMAMVHNRIIGGPPETMLELLGVPSRFPDATAAHIADWQESIIAWWWNAEKHDLLVKSLPKITVEEARVLLAWLRVEVPGRNAQKAAALKEIEAAVNAQRQE